ncbi:MAG TPA: hypothetical protein VEW48_26840 [Thermoanaerobaculia bacterium]|nr:hypothetical protein [Thermoanaerobaculia bacterium]
MFHGPSGFRHRVTGLAFALVALAAVPGSASAPTTLARFEPFTGFATGSLPGNNGYLLVWKDAQERLKVRRISATGVPGASKSLMTLDPYQNIRSVAVTASGAWAVFWIEPAGGDQIGIGGALFDAGDRLVRRMSFPDPLPDPGGLVISFEPRVLALPDGGFLVAFDVGIQDNPVNDPLQPTDTDVYLMRLDAAGEIAGGPVRLNQRTDGFQFLIDAGLSAHGLVVLWGSRLTTSAPITLWASVVDFDFAPLTEEFRINGTLPAHLAVGSDGRFVVAWLGDGVRIRAFGPTGTPLGAGHAVSANHPGAQTAPEVTATKEGVVWASWILVRDPDAPGGPDLDTWVRPFDLNARPTEKARKIATLDAGVSSLTGGKTGALITWGPTEKSPFLQGEVIGREKRSGEPPADQ